MPRWTSQLALALRLPFPLLVLHIAILIVSIDVETVFASAIVDYSEGNGEIKVATYGVDVSMPMHHKDKVSINYDFFPHNVLPALYPTPQMFRTMPIQPLGDRKLFYHQFMEECRARYGADSCNEYEEYRIRTNLQQPRSMVNYTETGFKVLPAANTNPIVSEMVQEFWKQHKEEWVPEVWPDGNTYVNHWSSPTYLVSVNNNNNNNQYDDNEEASLRGNNNNSRAADFHKLLWQAAKDAVGAWIPQVEEWMECSMYGIRIYTEGAILNSHVDRLPQVISIVINVAQDDTTADEASAPESSSWPLELIGHDGVARNVTLQPGDWLLYESHSIIHGRPFPFQGNYYANLYLHLEPKGHSQLHHHQQQSGADEQEYGGGDTKQQYATAFDSRSGGHETMDAAALLLLLPPYILADSTSAQEYAEQQNQDDNNNAKTIHDLAANGKLPELIDFVEASQRHLVSAKDHNGWTVSKTAIDWNSIILHELERNHDGREGKG